MGESSSQSLPETERKFCWLEFHQTLKQAGLTKERAAFQSSIGHLVEQVAAAIVGISGESYYDWMMTGSFVEGWGNNLFRLDGVTGIDSDIDWSQVVKHKVYHLKDSCTSIVDCINRKDYRLVDGHIQVKNCSLQPAFDTKRHGLRPDTDECHAYPCCSYPRTVLADAKIIVKINGNVAGNVDGLIVGNVDGTIDGKVDGKFVGKVSGKFDGMIDGKIARTVDKNASGSIDEQSDRTIDGGILQMVGGEFDGNIDGNINGKIAGTIDGKVCGKVVGKVDANVTTEKIDGQINGTIDGKIDGIIHGKFDGIVDGMIDGKVDGKADGNIDGTIDGKVHGRIHGKINGNVNGVIDGKVDGMVDVMINGQVDGMISGTVNGKVNGKVAGAVDGIIDGTVNGKVKGIDVSISDGEVCGEVSGNFHVKVNGKVDGEVKGKVDGKVDGTINGKVDGTIEGKVDVDVKVDKADAKPVCADFVKIINEQMDNAHPLEDVHFVRASVPGQNNQMRLSCTRQERYIMSQLSTVQGQLFTILKYLFKADDASNDQSATTRQQGVALPQAQQAPQSAVSQQSQARNISYVGSLQRQRHQSVSVQAADGTKKILESLKSFHAKTLLMTLLRDQKCWSWPMSDEDAAGAHHQLEYMVRKALEILHNSVKASIAEYNESQSQQQQQLSRQTSRSSSATESASAIEQEPEQGPKVPWVLKHALLADSNLYLKAKVPKKTGNEEILRLHLEALGDVKQDLDRLLGTDPGGMPLERVLLKYQERVKSMLEKRGIPGSVDPQPEEPFLFVPLLMLPRIHLDTLIEERKDSPQVEQNNGTPPVASQILKDAYIDVWIVLKSLSLNRRTPASGETDGKNLEECMEKIGKQNCLKTTYLCLRVMQLMKAGNRDAEIAGLLTTPRSTKRWINFNEELDRFVQTEDCIWAFHYFIKPKEKMDFSYLDEAQGVWKAEKAWSYKEKGSDNKFETRECLRDTCVQRSWMTHIEFKDDSKNSRQPCLTVNFDGLLDSFKRKRLVASEVGEDFFDCMKNCLFDPRIDEKRLNRSGSKAS